MSIESYQDVLSRERPRLSEESHRDCRDIRGSCADVIVTSYSIYGIFEQQTRPECIRVRLPRDWNTVDAVVKNRMVGVSLKESSRKEGRYEAKELNCLPTYLKPVPAVAVKATCCDEPGMITLSSFAPETSLPEISSTVKHRGALR
jgi:hypothetical protein